MKPPELTRAFICIEFPKEIITEVSRIQGMVKSKKFIGKLTEKENLHITLKFLGELTPEQLEKTKNYLSKIKFPEFEASLEHTGTFNKHKSPSIVWIKIGSLEILELQKHLDSSLQLLFPPEKGFMSHLTIARVKHVSNKEEFTDYIKHLSVQNLTFKVDSFSLKKSDLNSTSPTYTTIQEYNLK